MAWSTRISPKRASVSASAANRAANTVACASNLRQVGVALNLYADNNKSVWPWSSVQTSVGADQRLITWDDLITVYLGVKQSESEIYSYYNTMASRT